jgi:ABC-type transport system substrate-binding protein
VNNLKFFRLYLSRLSRRYYQKLVNSSKDFSFKRLAIGTVYIFFILLVFVVIFLFWRRNQVSVTCPSISEGIVGAYDNSNLPSSVTALLSDSLFQLDKTGSPAARLVENISSNQENTEFNLTLKKNLVWNDGVKVKSSDIKINLPDIEVNYPDDSTIHFKLADSFSPFLSLLTTPVLKPNSLIGLGKYKVSFQEINRGHISKLVLEPTDKKSCDVNPYVSIRFYQDEQTIKTAFNLGEIDAILAISDLNDFTKQPNVVVKKIQSFNKLTAIFYNFKDTILDKNYRKALNYSINPIENEDKAKTSIPQISWAYNTDLKEIHGDTASAKTFLAKVETGKDKPVTLTTSPYLANLAQKIVEDWKKVGINAVIRTESGNPQNFQALLTTVSIPRDPDQYALWHSTQANTNLSKYSSPRVDKDLEDGRKIGDTEKRKEKYFDFQKVLQDDAPASFLYFPKINVVYRQKAESNLNKILPTQITQY